MLLASKFYFGVPYTSLVQIFQQGKNPRKGFVRLKLDSTYKGQQYVRQKFALTQKIDRTVNARERHFRQYAIEMRLSVKVPQINNTCASYNRQGVFVLL